MRYIRTSYYYLYAFTFLPDDEVINVLEVLLRTDPGLMRRPLGLTRLLEELEPLLDERLDGVVMN